MSSLPHREKLDDQLRLKQSTEPLQEESAVDPVEPNLKPGPSANASFVDAPSVDASSANASSSSAQATTPGPNASSSNAHTSLAVAAGVAEQKRSERKKSDVVQQKNRVSMRDLTKKYGAIIFLCTALLLPWIVSVFVPDWSEMERLRLDGMMAQKELEHDYAAAEKLMSKSIALLPANSRSSFYAYEYWRAAERYRSWGKAKQSLIYYQKADDSDKRGVWAEEIDSPLIKEALAVGDYDLAQKVGLQFVAKAASQHQNQHQAIDWALVRGNVFLGDALEAVGKTPQALSSYKTAVDSKIEGYNTQYLGDFFHGCARYYMGTGNYTKAVSVLDRELQLSISYPSASFFQQSDILVELGRAYLAAANAQAPEISSPALKATDAFGEALKLDQQRLAPDDLDIARDYYYLGLAYVQSNDLARAPAALEKSLEIRTRILGANNPLTVAAQKALDALAPQK